MSMVIVGAGLAGLRTAEGLRDGGYEGSIVLVGDEVHLPYDRPPLSKEVLRGERTDTTLEPKSFYAELDIDLRLGVAAAGVDPAGRTLLLADGTNLRYQELIIATGLRPRRLPGMDLRGVHVLRSRDDAQRLHEAALQSRRAVVIGAGFIGCELASGFRGLGLEVILVEPAPTPLAAVLGEEVGGLIARLHAAEGVTVRTGTGIASLRGAGSVTGAVLTDDSEVEADLVAVGIGSDPAVDWLQGSGIDVGAGILADRSGRTNVPGVWTVGDVSAWQQGASARGIEHSRRIEHWSNVADQVRVLVPSLLGNEAPQQAPVPYFWSDQYDLKIQALGRPEVDDTVHVVEDDGRKFLAYYERSGELAAVVGAGLPGKVMKNRRLIAAHASMTEVLEAAPV